MTSTQANAKQKDPGWKYASLADPSNKNSVTCNFCNKVTKGGICRFKQHLIGGFRNAAACKKVPQDVRDEIKNHMEAFQMKKRDRNIFEGVIGDGRDEEGEIQIIEQGGAGSSKSKPIIRGLMDAFVQPKKSKNLIQSTMNQQLKKEARERACEKIARWFYNAGIPFNAAKHPDFKIAIDAVSHFGPGFKPPSYHELRIPLLNKEVKHTEELLQGHKEAWKKYGCTIMSDGWTDKRNRTLMNFLVNSPMGTMFLESIDASAFVKTGDKLFQLLDKIVQRIGPENVVQVCTDNASNYRLALRLLENKYPHMFGTPCAAHCLDLMLEDMCKNILVVKNAVKKGQALTNYIYNHAGLLSLMRGFTGGKELIRPGITRFATAFLTLQSIHDQKNSLRSMFTSEGWLESKWAKETKGKRVCETVLQTTFWNNILYVLKVSSPIVRVLRLVDGEDPAMGYIYEAISRVKETIKKAVDGNETKYGPIWNIIDTRWENQMHVDLHYAGYFLNPQFYYSDSEIDHDSKVNEGLIRCIEKMVPDVDVLNMLMKELSKYRNAEGLFGCKIAKLQRTTVHPGEWWKSYGSTTPNLQKFAMRILNLCCSSSGCERNWSVFENIHNKKRNRLEQKRLNDLVFIRYNQRLIFRHLNRNKGDPLSIDEIDDCDDWIAATLDEEQVFEEEGLTWREVEEAAGVNEAPGPSTRSRREINLEEVENFEEEEEIGDDDEVFFEGGEGNEDVGNDNEIDIEDV